MHGQSEDRNAGPLSGTASDSDARSPSASECVDAATYLAEQLREQADLLLAAGEPGRASVLAAEAITHLDRAGAELGPRDPGHVPLALLAADFEQLIWTSGTDPRSLDRLIARLATAIGGIAESDPFRADLQADLAELHLTRASEADSVPRQRADLDAAIGYARAVLDDPNWPDPADQSRTTDVQATCGYALASRFRLAYSLPGPVTAGTARSARADRDAAISLLGRALTGLAAGGADWRDAAAVTGQLLYDRYNDDWPDAPAPDPGDLDAAIGLLAPSAGDDPDAGHLWALVLALNDRAERHPEGGSDLTDLVGWAQRLLDHPVTGPEDAPAVRGILAESLLRRADQAAPGSERHRADLAAALGHVEAVLAAVPAGDQDRAYLLRMSALACWLEVQESPLAEDVDRLVRYARLAWQELPAGDPGRAEIGIYLVLGIQDQMLQPGVPFDRVTAGFVIDVLREAEPLVLDEPPLRLMAHVELAHFLVARGQDSGSSADLAAARPWLAAAVAEHRDAGLPGELTAILAGDMFVLASFGMAAGDLDGAIGLLEEAVRELPADPDQAPVIESALGLAYVQRAGYTLAAADLDAGIERLRSSFDAVPADDQYRLAIAWNLGSALLIRFQRTGDIQDRDAARYYLDVTGERGPLAGGPPSEHRALREAMYGLLRLVEAMGGDRPGFDEAVDHLRAAVAVLPSGHPHAGRLRADLGLALMVRAGQAGADGIADYAAAEAQLAAALAAAPPGHGMRPLIQIRRAGVGVGLAAARRDVAGLREAIAYLTEVLAEIPPAFGGRVRLVAALGAAWEMLFQLNGERSALDGAAHWLAVARAEFGEQPGQPEYARCLGLLAGVQRARGLLAPSREAGLAGLSARGRDVLLQSGTRRGLLAAKAAASEAVRVAGWCLADGEPGAAVRAIELGRALVLHSATSVADIAEVLAGEGHADLAAQWREQAAGRADPPWDLGERGADRAAGLLAGSADLEVPDDLRARTLAALTGSAVTGLLAPPSPAQIGSALTATGADALVYLLEPDENGTARAVIVPAGDAGPEVLPLPGLDAAGVRRIRDYVATLTAARPAEAPEAGDEQRAEEMRTWRRSLDELAAWAWPAVMRPLLDLLERPGRSRPPRLVLVPIGVLGQVPWHAATDPEAGPGPGRHACGRAVISYAASGRQLIDCAGWPALDLRASPVVVGNPSVDLAYAGLEAQAIRDRVYPGGRYLGHASRAGGRPADGPGLPDEVLGLLPSAVQSGASMVHLACHAVTVAAAPPESHLVLARGTRLALDTILRRAAGRPPTAPGGLISLAACGSDLAVADLDEALTLATAFLAAGAVTVVGTRWEIPDGPSALLMFMFHHFMAAGPATPRDALRMAQLWMLDPERMPPETMPAHLAREAGNPGLADLPAWAAVTHQGR